VPPSREGHRPTRGTRDRGTAIRGAVRDIQHFYRRISLGYTRKGAANVSKSVENGPGGAHRILRSWGRYCRQLRLVLVGLTPYPGLCGMYGWPRRSHSSRCLDDCWPGARVFFCPTRSCHRGAPRGVVIAPPFLRQNYIFATHFRVPPAVSLYLSLVRRL